MTPTGLQAAELVPNMTQYQMILERLLPNNKPDFVLVKIAVPIVLGKAEYIL